MLFLSREPSTIATSKHSPLHSVSDGRTHVSNGRNGLEKLVPSRGRSHLIAPVAVLNSRYALIKC